MPLGVALLFAAIAGLLVMASVGGARIWQLRHATKRNAREHAPHTPPNRKK
ncbi:hypothetical protein [Rhodococcus sp. IEGM 1318]|uniref:hypothetical protein n=1 Tax=Rhodococcus sp. IEGM 1318 TaxID=3082226 RepID=UPI0029550570|nr:hypothetical protein [Rhodococcus sp. IEGM 1318]MDV8009189.1 hypothetical protein [Rhodococcus sp. IEGM 1318]